MNYSLFEPWRQLISRLERAQQWKIPFVEQFVSCTESVTVYKADAKNWEIMRDLSLAGHEKIQLPQNKWMFFDKLRN